MSYVQAASFRSVTPSFLNQATEKPQENITELLDTSDRLLFSIASVIFSINSGNDCLT